MSGTLETKIMTPTEATGIVRGAFDEVTAALPMARLLPVKSTQGSLDVEWEKNVSHTQDLMSYSTWDSEAEYGSAQGGFNKQKIELLPMRKRLRVTEQDKITFGADDTRLKGTLDEMLTKLAKEAAWRVEKARIDVLLNAKLTLNENGVKGTFDFGRNKKLSPTVATPWDAASSDPVTDILAWVKEVKNLKGLNPTAVITTSDVLEVLETNAAFIQLVYGSSSAPTRIGRDDVLGVLRQYAHINNVLVADEAYTNVSVDYQTFVTDLLPRGTFLLAPSLDSDTLGYTALGPTVEAADANYGISGENSGFIGAVYRTEEPPAHEAYVNGSVLPVLERVDSTVSASVLTQP